MRGEWGQTSINHNEGYQKRFSEVNIFNASMPMQFLMCHEGGSFGAWGPPDSFRRSITSHKSAIIGDMG